MELSPEICGWVNSQTAEQLFSGMRRNNNFLNMMTPSSHVFLMRNILHHYNCFKNAAVMDNLKKSLGQEVTLNSYGQAVLGMHAMWASLCGSHDCCIDIGKAIMLLSYVLDTDKPPNEILVRCSNSCLTRSDFQTLGLQQQMDSTIGNACFRMIQKIAVSKVPYDLLKFLFKFAMKLRLCLNQGKNIHIVDLYVCPTWLPPINNDPMESIPSQAHQLDAIVIPLWTPGHYQICGFPRQLFGLDCGIFMIM
ncbi:unnamed protein product, partial [Menidia menidia]